MACEDVRAALSAFDACTETEEGARVATHCLYPSFDPVNVFVARFGDGFRVHDGGGAVQSAWLHGRDDSLIRRTLAKQAARYQVKVINDALVADAPSAEWLTAAILAVANASAAAAHTALDRVVSATEHILRDTILDVLKRTISESDIAIEYEIAGQSGKRHRFDFAVREPRDNLLLINAVAPHHISVSARYVAFADVIHREGESTNRFAVHEKPLESGDVLLLQQVAEIVPVKSLQQGILRLMHAR
jgi:hypothetical protein